MRRFVVAAVAAAALLVGASAHSMISVTFFVFTTSGCCTQKLELASTVASEGAVDHNAGLRFFRPRVAKNSPTPQIFGVWGQWEVVHPTEPSTESSPFMNLGCPGAPSYTGQAWFEVSYADLHSATFPGNTCTVLESSGDYYCLL